MIFSFFCTIYDLLLKVWTESMIVTFEDFEAFKKKSAECLFNKSPGSRLGPFYFFLQKYGLLSFNNRETAEIQQTSSS